jgi:hypothetical protein
MTEYVGALVAMASGREKAETASQASEATTLLRGDPVTTSFMAALVAPGISYGVETATMS